MGNKKIKRSNQRKLELEQRKRKVKKMIIVSLMLIIAMSVIVYIALSMGETEIVNNTEIAQEAEIKSETEVRIPTSDISNNAEFYSYDVDEVLVRYFAVKDSEGDIHVALDACDICYYEKKGYSQRGEVMHCINCGNEYPIESLGTENKVGGCWPSYLPMRIEGDDVIIEISDLEDKRRMF